MILMVDFVAGIAAIIVPLITVGKFGDLISSHSPNKTDAVNVLKQALTELETLRTKLKNILTGLPSTTEPAPTVHIGKVRKKREEPATTAPAVTTVAATESTTASVSPPAASDSTTAASDSTTAETSATDSTTASGAPSSDSTASAASSNDTTTASTASAVNTSSSDTVASSSVSTAESNTTTTTTTVSNNISSSNAVINASEPFNTVFDILDKIGESEKLFETGDYSSADNLETLLEKLHTASETLDNTSVTSDTTNLISHLLTKIENQQRVLNDSIKHLEISEVIFK